jgi:hypothetical protein
MTRTIDDTTPLDFKTCEYLMGRPFTEAERMRGYEKDKARAVARGLTGEEYEQWCQKSAERWNV